MPERAALVKTTDSNLTIKVPGQQDTVLNKSDVAKFGTADQRRIPLINFAARKSVFNPHKKLIENMEQQAEEQKQKILGQRNIRKTDLSYKSRQTHQVKPVKSKQNKNPEEENLPTLTTKGLPQEKEGLHGLITGLQPRRQRLPGNGRQPRIANDQNHWHTSDTTGPQHQHPYRRANARY